MKRCELHPLIKTPCYVCNGNDENSGANDYPPIEYKTLQRVLDELRISKETGAFARDQDLRTMLIDLRNSMVDGYEAIQSDIRDVRQMQRSKTGW